MKLILPDKMLFKGPDPPPADWKVDDAELRAQEEAAAINAKAAKGAKKGEEVQPPPEVPKSPEVEKADKQIRRFMKEFMTNLLTV